MKDNSLQVFIGRANPDLGRKISNYLGIPPGKMEVANFPDGEVDVKVLDDVRGADVFIVQPTCPNVNENLMELLIMVDCIKRASANRITAVVPYFGYARQDRKAEGRVPITAKLVANMLTTSGVSRVLTMDLHAPQIQGFFDIQVDHIFAAPVMIDHFRRLEVPDLVIVSPDVGGIKMARAYAKRLDADLAIIDKRRSGPSQIEAMHVIGEVKGKNVILVDDIISTASSITEAARAVRAAGAKSASICATHPVFCKGALEKVKSAEIKEVVVTDTIPLKSSDGMRILSVSGLLAEAIIRIHRSESVSSLFV
ncbi:MAG: ribose-phosphate pyrophosphokinase [Planctomycetes bacterium RBG_16_59_8]|nr:MAG: ribose-phosphate pyrophosphokinase [Planctomycetes bacterium RBG_16_59_8]